MAGIIFKHSSAYKWKCVTNRKIIYLVNPLSGTIKKGPFLFSLKTITESKGIPYEIAETNAAGNYLVIKEKISDENFTDVVIIGGDGTIRHIVNSLRDIKDLSFGIIPLGSGNGLARTANIPSKPLAALQLIFNGTPKYIDAFTINNHFSCMLSGIGFDAKVASDFAEKTARGLFTYTHQGLINYFKAQPHQFEISVNDVSFFTEAYFISIANSNQFGNNVTIAPQASLTDGLLDIVVVQKMNKVRLPFALLKQVRGNNKLQQIVDDMSKNNVLYFQTPAITIHNLKHAPFHIDGDPVETSEKFEVKIIKDCFKLIQP